MSLPSIWNKEEDRANVWTTAMYAVLSIFVVIVFGFIIAGFTVGLRAATAGYFGAAEAEVEIQSSEFRRAAQAGFFDQCASIQTNEGQIDALLITLADENISQRTRDFTVTQLGGVTATRKGAINNYNANAQNTYQEGQFRDADLPFQIPLTEYPEGGPTICVAAFPR